MADEILILTTEPLPIPGVIPSGAGLRAWGLGFGLRSAGFEKVTIAFAADAVRGMENAADAVEGVETFERGAIDSFIRSRNPAAVVFQHWGLWRDLKETPASPVAMDLAGPHLLERQLWGSNDPAGDVREKLTALSQADYVVCSGAFQRHYFLPYLLQAGHDPANRNLCPVIPFSLSPGLPEPDPNRNLDRFFYGGMLLPWQNPEPALRILLECMDEKEKGELVFMGGLHPGGDVSGGKFDALLEFLDGHPRVTREAATDFDSFVQMMRSCGCAIDLMERNAERELAFPTRTVTYLWAGLPVVHNDYDELAVPIGDAKAGWPIAPGDEEELRKRLLRLLTFHQDITRSSERAQNLVRERYTWDQTIEPLAEWCRDPQPRREKRPAAIPAVASPPEKTVQKRKKRPRGGAVTYAPEPSVTQGKGLNWWLASFAAVFALPVSAALIFLFALVEVARFLKAK